MALFVSDFGVTITMIVTTEMPGMSGAGTVLILLTPLVVTPHSHKKQMRCSTDGVTVKQPPYSLAPSTQMPSVLAWLVAGEVFCVE
jgi:hypothetical protein